jgi:hypothetical protein
MATTPPPLPPASLKQGFCLRLISVVPYILSLAATCYASLLVFGDMWFGFKNGSIFHTLFVTSTICLLSGIVAALINRGRELILYSIISAPAPALLLLLMLTGCIEDIQKQKSFATLMQNWPLLLIPPAIFLGQTSPVFIARMFKALPKQ